MGQVVGMAWAEQLPNGTWRGFWYNNEGRKRSKSGFKTEKAAKDHAAWVQGEVRRGRGIVDGRSPTWGVWSGTWLARRTVEASTARQDGVRVNRYLTPYWGGQRLNKISRGAVQEWVNELAQTPRAESAKEKRPRTVLSPATVARIFHLFSASMKAAVLDETMPVLVNPCVGVKLPTASKGHERYLSRAEFDLIASFLDEPYRTAAVLLVGTGMRFGEMAGLHWQRVDLEHNLIWVQDTWDAPSNTIKPYPKSREPRSVPIPTWLLPALTAQIDRQSEPATTCGLTHASGPRCRSGLVVTRPDGGPLDAHNIGRREWAAAVESAGVDHVRLHDLRHTYASWLRQSGVDLQEVQRLLGHASITTTQRYSHLGPTQNDKVRAALG